MTSVRLMGFLLTCGLVVAPFAYAADEFVGAPTSSEPSKLVPTPRTPNAKPSNDYNAIKGVVDGVIDALSRGDVIKMSTFYSTDLQSTFFGPLLYDETGRMVGAQKRSDYFQGLATTLSFFKSLQVRHRNDEVFRIGEHISLWTSTGDNLVVWKDGRESVRPWRWSIVLEKTTDGVWMIIHEHSSFGDPIVTSSQ